MTATQRAIVAVGAVFGLVLIARRGDAAHLSQWEPPGEADQYRSTISATERRNGIPAGLLASLLYQESRFRPDIIFGGPNHAGAVGIAQIIPRWHPGAVPGEPHAAIRYAGHYLRENFDRFGTWKRALAAYNWGPTNVQRHIASGSFNVDRLPGETRNYVRQVTERVFA